MNAPTPPTKPEQRKLQLASLHILVLKNQITAMELGEAEIAKALHTASELVRARIDGFERSANLARL
jgi:hypothetical protein